jgi:hypothetical protein
VAAFCETFDAPSSVRGRAGELDPAIWSGSRIQPQAPTGSGNAFAISPATIANCRPGLPERVLPDQDTLICDSSPSIGSKHLLVAVAAQNYGMSSYRVRQPFDFAGRSGTLVFDAEGFNQQLLGWISVEVTEDPIAVPSYGIAPNDEGGVLPKNGFELQFSYPCPAPQPSQFSLTALHVFHDYADTVVPADYLSPTPAPCVDFARGRLNHFEVHVSQQKIEVYVTPVSPDGVHFAAPILQLSQAVNLDFSRGYLHISTHNHATLKYSSNGALDAWLARWDNVAFDGPVLTGFREYEAPDALVPSQSPAGAVSIGYRVADIAHGPGDILHLQGVIPGAATKARLALSAWIPDGSYDRYLLKFRLNGGPWHDRALTRDEIVARTAPLLVGQAAGGSQGVLGLMLDVPLPELRAGDNTLEFVTENVPQSYPLGIANVDLVLTTQ